MRSFLTNVRFAVSCRVIELRDTVADPHQSEKPDPVPYQSQQELWKLKMELRMTLQCSQWRRKAGG